MITYFRRTSSAAWIFAQDNIVEAYGAFDIAWSFFWGRFGFPKSSRKTLKDTAGNIVAKIQHKSTLFLPRHRYDISMLMGNQLFFTLVSGNYFKAHKYTTKLPDGDLYEVFLHKRRQHSIFKNGAQIACCEHDRVHLGNKETIQIAYDSDADKYLLYAILFAVLGQIDYEQADISFDFGFGRELMPFDHSWQPK